MEARSPHRDDLENAIAKLLDVRDVLAAYARREDRLAQKRLSASRKRLSAPTKHTNAGAPPAQRSA